MHEITEEQLKGLSHWFDGYVKRYLDDRATEENITLKIDHTRRVCEEILMIARSQDLDEGAIRFARIIALFHDIGRFEQYRTYRTFADARSVDHAQLGVQILREEDVLHLLDPHVQELALRCIGYHNRAQLPHDETPECLYFSRMLRDADKLDIWRVVITYYEREDKTENKGLQLDLEDTPGVSQAVYDGLLAHQIVKTADVKNLNDFKLLQAGWVYDCNFPATLEAVCQRKYLGSIQSALPDQPAVTEIFTEIDRYLRARMEEYAAAGYEMS